MTHNTTGYGHLRKECWHLHPNMLAYVDGRWMKIRDVKTERDWWYITLENGEIWKRAGYETIPAVEDKDDITESESDLSINAARRIVEAVELWRTQLASLDREMNRLQRQHYEAQSPIAELMIEDDLREKFVGRNDLALKIKDTWARLPEDSFIRKIGAANYFKYREKYPAVTPKTKAALWTEYRVDRGSTARVLLPTSRMTLRLIDLSEPLSTSAPAPDYALITFEPWMFTNRAIWCMAFEPITDTVYMQSQESAV